MNWINLQVSIIRSPEYVGSNPTERATWFNVLAYCIEHENGGRIIDGANWKDRQWQQACGVTLREVLDAKKLITKKGESIVVLFYPNDKQQQVVAKRKQASAAAKTRWRNASRNASRNAEGEGEGKDNGREGMGASPPPQSPCGSAIRTEPETDAEWINRLSAQNPRIDIPKQLAKAHKKQRAKGCDVERGWFEEVWLPGVTPTVGAIGHQSTVQDGPPDWRETYSRLHPDAPPYEASWGTLAESTRKEIQLESQ